MKDLIRATLKSGAALYLFACMAIPGSASAQSSHLPKNLQRLLRKSTWPVPRCHGKYFEPCVCWQDVPTTISYSPSDKRCGKSTYPKDTENYNASISLGGEFRNTYSVVVRNQLNQDRSPYEPALCTRAQFDLGLSKCSRWKPQKVFYRNGVQVSCLGASGYSRVFRAIQRMTLKISDIPDEHGNKDIRRVCLQRPYLPLN